MADSGLRHRGHHDHTPDELTELQRLELEHAQRDAGALEDLQNSDALVTDQSKFTGRYYFRMATACFSISMGTTGSYFGFTCPASLLTYINEDIGPSNNASLVSIIWTAACAIAIILFGRLSDKFGRRWFVVGASFMGVIGGIIASRAQNMDTLVGANVLIGLSGGVHTCYGLTMGELVPNRYKTAAFSAVVVLCFVGISFAPIIGFRLIKLGPGWRFIYYIYIIFMAIATISQFFFYKPPSFKQLHGGKRTIMQEVKRIDFVGLFLLTAGMVLFILGISWGGQPVPWKSAQILCLLIIGFVLCVLFVLWEIYSNVPNPLMPMYFFKDVRGFTCLAIIDAISGAGYVAPSVIWPMQVANIYAAGSNPVGWEEQAWLTSAVTFAIVGGIVFWGAILPIIKHVKKQMILMALMVLAFSGGLVASSRDNKGRNAAFAFLSMFADGMLEITPLSLVQISANDADLGTVFGIICLFRTVTGSIFTAIYLAIFQNTLPEEIAKFVPSAVEAAGLPSSSLDELMTAVGDGTADALNAVPGMTGGILNATLDALVDAKTASFSYMYYATIPVNVIMLGAVLLMKDYDKLLTTHVPRQVYANGEGVEHHEKFGDVEGSPAHPSSEKVQNLEIEAAAAGSNSDREDVR
ncbi:hypothetical protein PV10_06067 [Exophiala mesophila]|uniref:Major facilitator superfamily (MFS) profile domain-containing protein n=1 Tax=Exophiala mesophila TaxID=212818 RepID=A0A0D1ZXL6_EXOME|nr:uncharacterized protein PV10_06067 [Exophiala mesophila]KIV91538.1 hypothetical protein PV10_06067 [Exophiala mesophila]